MSKTFTGVPETLLRIYLFFNNDIRCNYLAKVFFQAFESYDRKKASPFFYNEILPETRLEITKVRALSENIRETIKRSNHELLVFEAIGSGRLRAGRVGVALDFGFNVEWSRFGQVRFRSLGCFLNEKERDSASQ